MKKSPIRVQTSIRNAARNLIIAVVGLVFMPGAFAASPHTEDPHYNAAGFFDIHVCNWPDRPLFFQTLFSTPRFDEVEKIEIFDPKGASLGTLDLERYRPIKKKGKPEKRVFITQIPVADEMVDGWYEAETLLKNGERHRARDFVLIQRTSLPANIQPAHGAEDIPVPTRLSWDPIPGAMYYQVYIRDVWDGGRLIHKSRLLTKPAAPLPPGLLQPDGMYSWRIHARDVNEHQLLGDFNHGTTTGELEFTTAR